MNVVTMSARALSEAVRAKELGAAELMSATLARIEAVNGQVNAIVSMRDADQLMGEARAADAQEPRGWLHGIPIAIKDLANVAGLPTSMGSPLFAGQRASADDLMVQRIKAAGAIVIGKTNTPAFGLGSHTTNPVFGPTRNPYDATRSAGGSSGGAAAALSARMLAIADGSDMMGSLRNPAAWNNVYGMRPTWGRVPLEPGRDLFLHQLATSGPMARNPQDLALFLDTLSGADPRIPLSPVAGSAAPQLTQESAAMRIGWLSDWGGALPFEPGILEISEAALTELEALGHSVTPIAAPFSASAMWESWTVLRALAVTGELHVLEDDPAQAAQLNPAARWEIAKGRALTAVEITNASRLRSDWYRAVLELFDRFDVLVLPSTQCWPFDVNLAHPGEINGVEMDTYHRWMQVVVPASLIGLPVVNIPVGFGAAGLPAGLQLIGPRDSDARLLQLAQAWHGAHDWPNKRPPTF